MIHTEAVTKRFEDLQAVQDLSLQVRKGSIYGLLGSNGAGKSTFLKILAGVYKPDKGEVTINNKPVYEIPDTKQTILFISDHPYFFSQASLSDMAGFYRGVYERWNEKRYEQLAKHFRMDTNKRLTRMSKGMQRQAAFILGLSVMPDVMILDEPFDGLDPVIRQQMKNLIMQDVADRELTLIVSSHNLREMEDFCDYVGVLHEGSLLFERDLDELRTDVHKLQIAFKEPPEEGQLIKDMDALHYEVKGSIVFLIVKGQKDEVLSHVNRFNPAVVDMLPLTLEEIFIYELGGAGYEINNLIVE
ncbi:ABC transporter [Salipaludibacillus keqinensis]|uniref:ABC transporter n=1 Tax=Salipaludibacillus keqinensis TaxID=2045207 RepID=A0A323TKP9_9BACI|nr:ABC transporter ATP-binding protein [Salipaludibacillus keqinensis]PYZ94686.1 ABC transporter [Salipaludibacillus keqinensis]